MRVLSPHFVANKKVLLRLDIDVPLIEVGGKMEVGEDFRLQAALPTLYLCLQYAEEVIVMGHVGRPRGEDQRLSVAPIVEWFDKYIANFSFPEDRLMVLENLRFEKGEDECSEAYARELASMGDVYVNEAFAAHNRAASTTLVPKLLPSAVGFHFDHEVRELLSVREKPKKPLVAIIGGAKIEEKSKAVLGLSKFADAVLVGGLLAKEIKDSNLYIPPNVMVGKLNEHGIDMAPETIEAFCSVLANAKQVIWGGPLGKYEVSGGNMGDKKVAEAIIASGAESIIGGGDTVSALEQYMDYFSYVSTGGGAMLELLSTGTLPTIDALK